MYILQEILKEDYKKWKDRPYIYTKKDDKYVHTTFGSLIKKSIYLAESLQAKGLKNKRFLIYGENSVEWMEADLAIMGYLGLSIGIDKEWKLRDLINIVKNFNVEVIVYSECKKNIIEDLKEEFPQLIYISMQNDFPMLIGEGEKINSTKRDLFDLEENSYTEPIKVVFSSGTTSFPKAVLLKQKNLFAGYESLMKRTPLNETDKIYLFLPLHHTYAGIYNFILSLIYGPEIYLSTGVQNIATELQEVKPTIMCAVPLILYRMYEAVNSDSSKLNYAFGGNIKYLFTGGAKIDRNLKRIYKNEGINLLEAYALSETASSFAIEYPNLEEIDCVGTIFEDLDVKIDKPDENGIGEIICKGDCVFCGYLNNDIATRQAFDEDGYFHTGDLGYIKNNNLFITGRKKRVILFSNGENIYPENIENRIIEKDSNINSVKVYLYDSKLKADIYLKKENARDYHKIIEEVNEEGSKFEKITFFEIFIDSVDVRMKQ